MKKTMPATTEYATMNAREAFASRKPSPPFTAPRMSRARPYQM